MSREDRAHPNWNCYRVRHVRYLTGAWRRAKRHTGGPREDIYTHRIRRLDGGWEIKEEGHRRRETGREVEGKVRTHSN